MVKRALRELRKKPAELAAALLAIAHGELAHGIANMFKAGELRLAPAKPNAWSICEKFYEYDRVNPHVAEWMLQKAQSLKTEQHRKRYGIGALTERIRWDVREGTIKTDGFRISNDIRACYARQVLMRDPTLCGLFAIRPSAVDESLVVDGRRWSDFAIEHQAELWPDRIDTPKKPSESVREVPVPAATKGERHGS